MEYFRVIIVGVNSKYICLSLLLFIADIRNFEVDGCQRKKIYLGSQCY